MKSIPLTRARHASNFVIALKQIGASSNGLLERANLSAEMLNGMGGDGVISALSMLEFAEMAARETGKRDLGILAGGVPLLEYGDFGRRISHAPTLLSAIKSFCNEVRGECSEADYFLTYDEDQAWLCHGQVGTDQVQHELYGLRIILQVIQLALGTHWQPEQIRLQFCDEAAIRDNETLTHSNIEFGAAITGVAFPLKHLDAPLIVPGRSDSTNTPSLPHRFDMSLSEPMTALKELITSCRKQSQIPPIDTAAELAGVSKRTLQRYLADQATSYSELVDQVRFEAAVPLLRDPSISITEISFELGYADIAHFSRAFKRISGISPRAYRKLLAT